MIDSWNSYCHLTKEELDVEALSVLVICSSSPTVVSCCCLVTQSRPTLGDPMDCSTPGFPVLCHVSELAQTRVHWVSDAIQQSCPLSSPSPPAFNLSQLISGSFLMSQLFTSGGQRIGASALVSVLPMNIQDWFPCSPRDSQESSPTPQFKSINSSALSLLHSSTLKSIHDHRKNHSLE